MDPVATISIFKMLGVNDRLYMLVFGESTMNDAVSIALFKSFSVVTQGEFDEEALVDTI